MIAALQLQSILAVVSRDAGSSSELPSVFLSVALRVSALLLLTALAVRLLRDHSAGRRHLVIVLGALGALVIPVLAISGPRWNVPVLPVRGADLAPLAIANDLVPLRAEHALASDAGRPVGPTAQLSPTPTSKLPALSPLGLAPAAPRSWGGRSRSGGEGSAGSAASADATIDAPPAATVTRAPSVDGASSLNPIATLTDWEPSVALQLFLAWLFGATLLVGQLVVGVIRRSRLAHASTDLLPAPWERSRARLVARGALPPRVRLLATSRSSMPMTWGVVRPVVLVPEHSEWTSDERDAALLHELAHVRRGDALWLTVLSLVRALHWYNPLAWWLCGAERLTREEACDDLVLETGVRPSAYAEQLLGIVQQPSEWRAPAAALAMARPGSLARRLQSILKAEQRRDLPGAAARALSITSAALLAGCLGSATPVQRAVTTPSPDANFAATAGVAALAAMPSEPDASRDMSPTRAERPASGGYAAGAFTTSSSESPSALGSYSATAGFSTGAGAAASAGSSTGFSSGVSTSFGTSFSTAGGGATSVGSALGAEVAGVAYAGASAAGGRVAIWNDVIDAGTATATIPAAQQQCAGSKSRNMSSSHSSNSNDRTESVIWSRNGCKIELTARGEYTLTANLDDLRSLSRGGSFVLREDDGRAEREVRITPNSDGTLDHRYRVDGETRPWESEGKTWFAQVALRLDRATAWAVDVRFPALMSRGGVDAVLAEIDLLEGDYARRVYFTKLATSAQLSSAQLVRVIDMAGAKIQSDYELTELLIAASKQRAFDDPAQLSLARAASRIKSDYEKRRAFTALLSKDGLSAATVGEILAGTKGMESDYELAELLIEIASRYAIPQSTRRYYLDALGTIQSDYEYRRVVSALAKRPPLPADFTKEILAHASMHVKGFELAELLITMDKLLGRERTLASSWLDAAGQLDSDYEHGRVLKDLVAQRPDTDVIVQLLKQAPRVGSAYERAELLLAVARTYRIDGALHDSYVDAARSIDSDYERGRALAAAEGRRAER